jgi:hypothetical protein
VRVCAGARGGFERRACITGRAAASAAAHWVEEVVAGMARAAGSAAVAGAVVVVVEAQVAGKRGAIGMYETNKDSETRPPHRFGRWDGC